MADDISDEDKALFRQAVKAIKNESNQQSSQNQYKPLSISSIGLSSYYQHPVGSDSVLSFQRKGVSIHQFKQLKSGQLPIRARLDLHGFIVDSAEQALLTFIANQLCNDHRCVLIIHGKGSPDGNPPVLKNLVNHWLPQIPEVLAFHSAKSKDGGVGALYVLLKRVRS